MAGVVMSLYADVTLGPAPEDYDDYLALGGRYDVHAGAAMCDLYLRLLPEFFVADAVERDRVVCAEVQARFPQKELTALGKLVKEYNASRNAARQAALAAHIQTLLLLYTTFIRTQRALHTRIKKKMDPTAAAAFVKVRGGDELTDAERAAAAAHLGVPARKLAPLMKAYVEEAMATMWVEKPGFRK